MPTAKQYIFKHTELAEILVKQQGIHEGHWGVYLEFGFKGSNVDIGGKDLKPAALVTIQTIGLQLFDKPNSLTVDAARVNAKHRGADRISPTTDRAK